MTPELSVVPTPLYLLWIASGLSSAAEVCPLTGLMNSS